MFYKIQKNVCGLRPRDTPFKIFGLASLGVPMKRSAIYTLL